MNPSRSALSDAPLTPGRTLRAHRAALAGACTLALLLAASAASAAASPGFPVLWQTNLQTFLESAPTLADLRGDGRQEVVMAGREELFALDVQGKELWHWRTKSRFMTCPAVLSRPPHPALIYAADNSGWFTCLDGAGKEVWHAQLNGPSTWSSSVLCDLDGSGQTAVIQTDEPGTVWAFSALDGKVLWQAKVKGMPVSPAAGDLNGDGKREIVVATGEGMLAAFKPNGQLLWQRDIGGASPTWSTPAPIIFAASDGRARVAAASSAGELLCLDAKGAVLWRHATRGPAASSLSVGDLDLDGRADICLVTQTGVIYRFDEDGRVIWEIDMQGRSLAPGAIADIDGDGKPEYVLFTQNGQMLVLNNQGEFIYRHQFPHRTINMTAPVGRICPNAPGLGMAVTGGESGMAYCLGTPAPANALVQWGAYRADARNSGSWFGLAHAAAASMAPVNVAGDQVFTGEPIRFAVRNPGAPEPLTASAVCLRADGARQAATTAIVLDRGELLMPVPVGVPGTYRFDWTLEDSHGHRLASGQRSVFFQPFVNDNALAARAINALREAARVANPMLPLTAKALRREAQSLQDRANNAGTTQRSAPAGTPAAVQAALDDTAGLTAHARRGLGLAQAGRQAASLGAGTSLLAFEGTLWENRKVDEQLPPRAKNPVEIRHTAVPGEHEPVPVDIFNVTDHELLVRVLIDGLTNGVRVTPRHSLGVPTSLGEVAWDPLPELDNSATLSIPSLASRELWLDIDLADAKPCDQQVIQVRLQALNGAGVLDAPATPHSVPPPETKVLIQLRILPFTMSPPGALRLCTWGGPGEDQIADLLDHGNNVFSVGLPPPKTDPQGRVTGCDCRGMDPVLARFHVHDVVVLLTGLPSLRGKPGSADYQADLKAFLDDLVPHMASFGLDTNHFALYPFDEPGGYGWTAVIQLVEFGKQVHALKPGVMLYADGGGELPMFQAMATCIDVWCPPIPMLVEDSPSMDLIRHHGKMLWSYDCGYGYSRPVGANLKNINLVAQYRTAALFALRHGATGIGYWCYNAGPDPWPRIDMEYMLVYPGQKGPVASRRWEAVREGIEDSASWTRWPRPPRPPAPPASRTTPAPGSSTSSRSACPASWTPVTTWPDAAWGARPSTPATTTPPSPGSAGR